MKGHLTYANVVSTLCLFIVLGGSAVAAVQLSKNSVRSRNIKNGEVRSADLRAGAVNSRKVKNRSLLAEDFAAGQLTPGPKGDTGAPGERGPRGEAGPGAAKLLLDQPATGPADPEPIGTVGPFEFAFVCDLIGGEDIAPSLRVRGGTDAQFQLAGVDAPNDTAQTVKTSGGQIPAADQPYTSVWNTGIVSTGNFRRIAGTIQLKSGTSVSTATFNIVADNRDGANPRCFGYGTGVPAS
jgi:hypothetical protein